MANTVALYDTTLRDGSQLFGISFSLKDKLKICHLLDEFKIDYIEAGWPGSNPKDKDFFEQIKKQPLKHSKLVAFGATKKPFIDVKLDKQVKALVDAQTSAIALVAKFWDLHVSEIFRIELSENLKMISETVSYLKSLNKEVIVDAEHFFDGYQDNPEYSHQCIQAAFEAGADNITLCDTNGGQTPDKIFNIVQALTKKYPHINFGIHCHNDCELAVANSLQAIMAGAKLLQGTINGYGERCGNANLIALIPTIQIKTEHQIKSPIELGNLSKLAQQVADIANIPLNPSAAYVGPNAFTHKGGIHVSAVAKLARSYEHIDPALVGSHRNVTISELSGKSNIKVKAQELGLTFDETNLSVLEQIKQLENEGLTLENAKGTFELLLRKQQQYSAPFELQNIYVQTNDLVSEEKYCTAIVKNLIDGQTEHVVSEAKGPVDALNTALKKSLQKTYPIVSDFRLTDYKVSIIDPENAAAAKTRVWVEASAFNQVWSTIGCSDNILDASAQALSDSYELFLIRFNQPEFNQEVKDNGHYRTA